jgi:hypothetical protein
MIQSDLLSGFLSRILGSAILPPWVDLFHQRDDSGGQPMGGYVGGGGFDRSRLFKRSPLIFRELAHERRKARFMVLIEITDRLELENEPSEN